MSCRPTHKKWSAVPLFRMGSVSGHRFFLLLKGTFQKHRTQRPFQVQAKNHSLNMLKTPNFLGFFPSEIHPSNHMRRRRRKKKTSHLTFKCHWKNATSLKMLISHPKKIPRIFPTIPLFRGILPAPTVETRTARRSSAIRRPRRKPRPLPRQLERPSTPSSVVCYRCSSI